MQNLSPYSTGYWVCVGYKTQMKSTQKKTWNVHGQREKFAFGTQRNLYSTDSRWGFALGDVKNLRHPTQHVGILCSNHSIGVVTTWLLPNVISPWQTRQWPKSFFFFLIVLLQTTRNHRHLDLIHFPRVSYKSWIFLLSYKFKISLTSPWTWK